MILLDYFVQLTVVIRVSRPARRGPVAVPPVQPHGLFIALEALGYLALSVALLCAAPVRGGPRPAGDPLVVRGWLCAGGRGVHRVRDDRTRLVAFEVTILSINWIVLIASGGLLAVTFRRGPDGGA